MLSLALALCLLAPVPPQEKQAAMERALADTVLALDVLNELQGRLERDPDGVTGMLDLVTEAPGFDDAERQDRLGDLHSEVDLRQLELNVLEAATPPQRAVSGAELQLPEARGTGRRAEPAAPRAGPTRAEATRADVHGENDSLATETEVVAPPEARPWQSVALGEWLAEEWLLGLGALLSLNAAFVLWLLRSTRRNRATMEGEVEGLTDAVRKLRRATLYPQPASDRSGPVEQPLAEAAPARSARRDLAIPPVYRRDRGYFRRRVEGLVGVQGYSRLSREERNQRVDAYVATTRGRRMGSARTATRPIGGAVEEQAKEDRLDRLERRMAELSELLERAERSKGPRRGRHEDTGVSPDDPDGGAKHGLLTQIFEENVKLQGRGRY